MSVPLKYIGAQHRYFDTVDGSREQWTPGDSSDVADSAALGLIATGYFGPVEGAPLNTYTAAQLSAMAAAGTLTPLATYVASDTGDRYWASGAGTLLIDPPVGNGSGQLLRLKSFNGASFQVTGDTNEYVLASVAIPDGFFTDIRNELRVQYGVNCTSNTNLKQIRCYIGQSFATATQINVHNVTSNNTGAGRQVSLAADPLNDARLVVMLGNALQHFGGTTAGATSPLAGRITTVDPTSTGLSLYVTGKLGVGTDQLTLEALMVDAVYGRE